MELQARSENTRFFYQAIKKLYGPQKSRYVPQMIKTANGKILSSPTQVRERWKQYFSDLLSKECLTAVDLDKYIPDRLIQWQLNDPPTIEEIEKAFERLNNHKCQEKMVLWEKLSNTANLPHFYELFVKSTQKLGPQETYQS